MKALEKVSRRNALKLASVGALSSLTPSALSAMRASHPSVPVWEVFELTLEGPATGNPFLDVQLSAIFSIGHRTVEVDGFYDGEKSGKGIYKIRFMPDTAGNWSYTVSSNLPALSGQRGDFAATQPLANAHGPVRVHNTHHFAYADGVPFFPFGTTCYAWVHQSEEIQKQTLDTLRSAPFNKIRMCVFPKSYEYNHNEPPLYPFERDSAGKSDFTRLNPRFFEKIEERIADLRALNIEADLILFHPYDRWGYASMPAEADDRYLRYVIARFSAYRNIWWSLANEYDLMKHKSTQDFDRFFHIVEERDPYAHLRSVHYSNVMYDYARPWVTHASLQTSDFSIAARDLPAWRKPICFDEVMYEGNLNRRWGNISGTEMTRRFWLGVIAGCYVTHGETYLDPKQPFDEESTPVIWWSHGGKLHGSSPAQIAFLRKLVEESIYSDGHPVPALYSRSGFEADTKSYYLNATAYAEDGKHARTILYFFDFHQPIWYEFPLPEGTFTAEKIDPIEMTVTPISGRFSGPTKLQLSGSPLQAIRFRAV